MNRLVLLAACGLCQLVACSGAFAQTQADIRFVSGVEGPVWKGQAVPLYLEIWSDGFSFSGQSFPLPEVPGGYLVRGGGSTVNLSERRGLDSWQGLRYEIKYYPQVAGIKEIPSFPVQFQVTAGFGSEPTGFKFVTRPLLLDVRLPPGADPDALLVTSGRYDLRYDWSLPVEPGEPLEIMVGDAVVLEVVRSADDVPGMMFEPLPSPQLEGLGVYADKPQVRDRSNRGQITSQRTDRVTYVAEMAGNYRLPERVFQSWNPQAEVLSEHRIPALQLAVSPNPAWAPGAGAESTSGVEPRTWWILLALLAAGLLGWRFGPAAIQSANAHWHNRRDMRAASEAGRFREVKRACRAGDSRRACKALTWWLATVAGPAPVSLLQMARDSGISGLEPAMMDLQESLLRDAAWNGAPLAEGLDELRQNLRRQGVREKALPPLNPD